MREWRTIRRDIYAALSNYDCNVYYHRPTSDGECGYFEINIDDNKSQIIDVEMSLDSFRIGDMRYFKLCKIKDGELCEIEYTIEKNIIKFSINTDEAIIVLEEQNHIARNMPAIIIVIAMAVISLALIATMSIRMYLLRKKQK